MKEHAPAAERNRREILPVLEGVLPASGLVLEIGSGTGQHAIHFAPSFPDATWQPSDVRPAALASIAAWREEAGVGNVAPPIELDVTAERWPVPRAAAIVAINVLHVMPWSSAEALLAGAGRILEAGAPLVLYGAFLRDDRPTAPSNLAFDRSLRAQDPDWGVRRLEDVVAAAAPRGMEPDRVVDMPNRNFLVVLRRVGGDPGGP